jgi:hypothetical protein
MRSDIHIFDNFMERILVSVASQYIPKLQNITSVRADELTVMKEKILTSPEEVEAWFDKKIERVRNVDMLGLINKLKAENIS